MGVWAHSDIIKFIKGKSCLCFPWRSYGGSDITMVKQADGVVPVALIRMWLHPKPTFFFFTALSCLKAWMRVIGQCEEMTFVRLRYVSQTPLTNFLLAIEFELKPLNEEPFKVIFQSAYVCVVNIKHFGNCEKSELHDITFYALSCELLTVFR